MEHAASNMCFPHERDLPVIRGQIDFAHQLVWDRTWNAGSVLQLQVSWWQRLANISRLTKEREVAFPMSPIIPAPRKEHDFFGSVLLRKGVPSQTQFFLDP